VRFAPKYDVFELRVISPGMVISSPVIALIVECPCIPVRHDESSETELVLENPVECVVIIACVRPVDEVGKST